MAVRVEGIERRFGPTILFEGLSWTIPAGARLGLVGPNGAGKTTLLRIVAGLDDPDGGIVHRPSAWRVGYLAQEVETVGTGSVLSAVLDGDAELRRVERRLRELESRMAGRAAGDPELPGLTQAYGDCRGQFDLLGGDRAEARARAILSGLGVPEDRFEEPLPRLSGGWRMRVALARLLIGRPGLLLLDEPTNHLDLGATAWLEGFLERYQGAFVVVSHDRYFLNRMVQGIVELEGGRLTAFRGGYDDYLVEREAREQRLRKAAREQARELRRVERFIERFRYKNTKARQVQSRLTALGKVERIEVGKERKRLRFGIPRAPRAGDVVARCENAAKRFGDRRVYTDLNLILRRGDRLALVGPNGTGKSTLLRLLAGTVAPDAGRCEPGHGVIERYYAQHQLESLDPERTVLQELETVAEPSLRPRLRSLLGCFLFPGQSVEKKVAVLSGGEKARLALCKLLARPANLLLLDEPTNHLDLPSREVLEEALDEYDGTLVVVSHDRYFINRIATSVARVGDGTLEVYPGDFDSYLAATGDRAAGALEATAETSMRPTRADRPAAGGPSLREVRRSEAEARNRRYRQRRASAERLVPLEARIAELEQRIRELDQRQADPQVYADPESARATGRERAETEAALERLYAEWEELASEEPGNA